MDTRLDSPFESWGGFKEAANGSPIIHGRLRYDPKKGIELDLVENPNGVNVLGHAGIRTIKTIFGQLVNGTLVTLSDCFATKSSIQLGIGIGSPTTLFVNRAVFGGHIADLGQLLVKRHSAELSSLANWTCTAPVKVDNVAAADGKDRGFDVCCRVPVSIDVPLPNREFDVQIGHEMTMQSEACVVTVGWAAALTILPHDSMPLEKVGEIAWQCQNLMSLLIGEALSTRLTIIVTAAPSQVPDRERELQLVYLQRGQHDHRDLFVPEMMLPYGMVKDEFPAMVEKWFGRAEQALLATNVFFGSQDMQSQPGDVRFMDAARAAESYHRSLGTGLYMEKAAYDTAVQELETHIPTCIQGDHRHSLRKRLMYGNEYSLRKRLTDMFNRIPENTQRRIAGDVGGFVTKVVNTRNYHTHYDHAGQANVFDGKDMHTAAERLRILVTANLLHDLGVKDENLTAVLERRWEFAQWLSQPLTL